MATSHCTLYGYDVRGAVLIRALQLQHHLAGAITLEPPIGNGRVGNVATQVFERFALIGAAAHRSVSMGLRHLCELI